MSKPRNEGRYFTAWCGGRYVFAHNSEGKLCVKPNPPRWWVIHSLTEFARRMEKEIQFQELYGIPGKQEPISEGTGRFQINSVPLESPPNDSVRAMREHLKALSFNLRYSR